MAEKPAWEVGQWWSYVEHRDDGIEWFNQTVVGVEEKHGFQTYRVREEFTYTKDTDGRSRATAWYDVDSLGLIAYDVGIPLWWDCPMRAMYPPEETPWSNCTMQTAQGVQGELQIRLVSEGETKITVAAGTFDSVEIITQGMDGDEIGEFSRVWYSPEVESYVRLTEHGWYTRELAAWGT